MATRAVLRATYVTQADAAVLHYNDLASAADKAALAEDAAWTRLSTIAPATRADLLLWSDYVFEHAAKGDEFVTLQRAVKHLAGVMADRAAA